MLIVSDMRTESGRCTPERVPYKSCMLVPLFPCTGEGFVVWIFHLNVIDQLPTEWSIAERKRYKDGTSYLERNMI